MSRYVGIRSSSDLQTRKSDPRAQKYKINIQPSRKLPVEVAQANLHLLSPSSPDKLCPFDNTIIMNREWTRQKCPRIPSVEDTKEQHGHKQITLASIRRKIKDP
jgi:hypothetical protein